MLQKEITAILSHPEFYLADCPADAAASLEKFLLRLETWTARINLTSEKTADRILKQHVFDSLQFARALKTGGRLLDIGSGAGFPGIPLKIVRPGLDVVLLESQKRRVNFLKTVVRELQLSSIAAVEGRAEDFCTDTHWTGRFDAVVLRAVASIPQCAELAHPFLRPGGRMLLSKDPGEYDPQEPPRGFDLLESRPITGYFGRNSELLVFEKRST